MQDTAADRRVADLRVELQSQGAPDGERLVDPAGRRQPRGRRPRGRQRLDSVRQEEAVVVPFQPGTGID